MSVKNFTGFEYLLIDAANQYGNDKMLFEDRIKWAMDNFDQLEAIGKPDTKEYPQYVKAVQTIRNAQKGNPTGHLVGLDASNSGLQIMSILTGCIDGASATGLVDPNRRADAYTDLNNLMQEILGTAVEVNREDSKLAFMTSLYGSRAEPIKIFGKDTPELKAFYKAAQAISGGSWELLHILLNAWKPYALKHSWVSPDGLDVSIKVMVDKETQIEVDELNHTKFNYYYSENEGTERGVSLAANLVHHMDAYIVRQMHRRCNYDKKDVFEFISLCHSDHKPNNKPLNHKVFNIFKETGLVDLSMINVFLNDVSLFGNSNVPKGMVELLLKQCNSVMEHEPFEILTNHDEFRCHVNNCNFMRKHYREILSDIALSNTLQFLLRQLFDNHEAVYNKHGDSRKLSEYILNSNYAIC